MVKVLTTAEYNELDRKFNAPKIELKKVEFSERMSEETNAFVADLYINGKKIGYCKNDGQGGCTDYRGYTREDDKIIADVEAYCKTLPKAKSIDFNFEYQPTFESMIDDCFEQWLKKREEKKMQKLFKTAIVFGKPNGSNYSFIKTKIPLSKIPQSILQNYVNQLVLTHCKKGVVILNNNLNELGITIP